LGYKGDREGGVRPATDERDKKVYKSGTLPSKTRVK